MSYFWGHFIIAVALLWLGNHAEIVVACNNPVVARFGDVYRLKINDFFHNLNLLVFAQYRDFII